jgi:hypothetical protein
MRTVFRAVTAVGIVVVGTVFAPAARALTGVKSSSSVVILASSASAAASPVPSDERPAPGDDTKAQLLVDRDHGRVGGACTKDDPCARITDAVAIARALRYGLDPEIPKLKRRTRIVITVRASSNAYLGSPDPVRLAADPSLEPLPLFLNISDLDLVGESKFQTDQSGWIVADAAIADATTIKSEAPLPVGRNIPLILIGVTDGMTADRVCVRGFVLDGSTSPGRTGFLISVDRGKGFVIRDIFGVNATYGVATQGASGVVARSLFTGLGEGVLVFAGNSADGPADVTVRHTRAVRNLFGGLAFFGTTLVPTKGLPAFVDFGAYAGVFVPVPFTGIADRTVGRVIHNDLSENTAVPVVTAGLRMALVGPNLPPGQSAGHLFMIVKGNRLDDNAHAFSIDAGFPFRASPTDFAGSFACRFANNEATGSRTAKAIVTFTRNNAAETLPGSMTVWKYVVNSRFHVMYSGGEFDEAPGSSGRVWIDNPDVDPGDPGRLLNNELILVDSSRR